MTRRRGKCGQFAGWGYLSVLLLGCMQSSDSLSLHHDRRLLQEFTSVPNVATEPLRGNGTSPAPGPSGHIERNASNAASPENSTSKAPSPGAHFSVLVISQRPPPVTPIPSVPAAGAAIVSPSPPSLPPSSPPIPRVPIPPSSRNRLSNAVIIIISLSAALFVSAVVASAIQIARRRRQRRALLVNRGGAVSKPGAGNQRPVLDIGSNNSQPPSSAAFDHSDSKQSHETPDRIAAIIPSFQRHKKSVYIPQFLLRKLGSHPEASQGTKVANQYETYPLSEGDPSGQIEMQLTSDTGPAPMEIDDFETIALNDTSQEMDYETSGSPDPVSSVAQDSEAQSHLQWQSSVSSSHLREVAARGSQDAPSSFVDRGASADRSSIRHIATDWQEQSRRASLEESEDRCRSLKSSTGSLTEQEIEPSEIRFCFRNDGDQWKLGEGGFGSVYKALRGGTTEVAVKVLNASASMDLKAFRQEAAVLAACRDPHICQFLGACFQPGATMIVTEYCPEGDLRAKLSSLTDGVKYQWANLGRKLMLDVAAGLSFLHSRRIIHFDLKSSNVMLVRGDSAKITDVGMAAVMSNADYVSQLNHIGTFAYAAPELLLGRKCSPAADIFSFGVLIHEVVTGEMPRRGNLKDLRSPEHPGNDKVPALIAACTEEDPKKRPTALQIFEAIRAML